MKKLVVIISCFQYPHSGGLSRVIHDEASFFKSKGYNIKIICPIDKNPEINNPEILYIFVPPFLRGFFHRLFFSIKSLSTINNLKTEDLYFIDCQDIFSFLSVWLSHLTHKSILTLHSIQSKDVYTMSSRYKANKIMFILFMVESLFNLLVELIIINIAPKIICVSDYEYTDTIKKRLNKKDVYIIRNAINIISFESLEKDVNGYKQEIKDNWGIRNNDRVVMFLGRMVPKNGPMLVIKAAKIVINKFPNCKFIFVGDGEERQKLEGYAQENDINLKVIFTGSIPAEKILPIADIFVSHCSSLVDGPGLTIFEAMFLAIPTITGRDYIKEKLFSEREICLVEKDSSSAIANKICEIIENYSDFVKVGMNAKEKIRKEYSIERRMDQLENVVLI